MMSKRKIWLAVALTVFACAAIAALSSRRVRAYAICTVGMKSSTLDARVFVEEGVQLDWIECVVDSIDRSTARIEAVQGAAFADEVRVYLCASQRSYNRRTGDRENGFARGAVFADRVFLSPRCMNTGTTEAILTHELSHLHLRQIMGVRYVTGVPGWFQEGLAVYASRGGGAEQVARETAIAAILQGRCIDPEGEGASVPTGATDHSLSHQMFYRQSALFVEYLDEAARGSLKTFLAELQEGAEFATAFSAQFSGTPRELWSIYRESLSESSDL